MTPLLPASPTRANPSQSQGAGRICPRTSPKPIRDPCAPGAVAVIVTVFTGIDYVREQLAGPRRDDE